MCVSLTVMKSAEVIYKLVEEIYSFGQGREDANCTILGHTCPEQPLTRSLCGSTPLGTPMAQEGESVNNISMGIKNFPPS